MSSSLRQQSGPKTPPLNMSRFSTAANQASSGTSGRNGGPNLFAGQRAPTTTPRHTPVVDLTQDDDEDDDFPVTRGEAQEPVVDDEDDDVMIVDVVRSPLALKGTKVPTRPPSPKRPIPSLDSASIVSSLSKTTRNGNINTFFQPITPAEPKPKKPVQGPIVNSFRKAAQKDVSKPSGPSASQSRGSSSRGPHSSASSKSVETTVPPRPRPQIAPPPLRKPSEPALLPRTQPQVAPPPGLRKPSKLLSVTTKATSTPLALPRPRTPPLEPPIIESETSMQWTQDTSPSLEALPSPDLFDASPMETEPPPAVFPAPPPARAIKIPYAPVSLPSLASEKQPSSPPPAYTDFPSDSSALGGPMSSPSVPVHVDVAYPAEVRPSLESRPHIPWPTQVPEPTAPPPPYSSFVRASALPSTTTADTDAATPLWSKAATAIRPPVVPPVIPPSVSKAPAPAQPIPNRSGGSVTNLWGNGKVPRSRAYQAKQSSHSATGPGAAGHVPGRSADSERRNDAADDEEGGEGREDEEGQKARYAVYESKMEWGVEHPDELVEAASLAACPLPPRTYTPRLVTDPRGAKALDVGLSKIQMENLVYACQRHDSMLPNGKERAGFFIGDGAGVGKGRSIAGIVLENHLIATSSDSSFESDTSFLAPSPPGRRDRAVWFSISADLVEDARRDMKDVGAETLKLFSLTGQPYGPLSMGGGVLFSTYATLIGQAKSPKRDTETRLGQIVEWCGGLSFEGLLIFDESHKGKNLVPPGQKKGELFGSDEKGTKTGKAILSIQERLPNARVLYVSATGASEPRNMAYMVRLGLWGAKTAFPHFGAFLSAVSQRGAGAMECVACDMKAMGVYLSRTLSYTDATFEIARFSLDQTEISYDEAARLWVEIKTTLEGWVRNATETLEGKKVAALWRYYWGSFQRFFKYLCISAKVPKTIELAREALRNGKSVVIGLQGTGEARTADRLDDEGDDLDDLVSAPREVAKGMIDHFAMKCFGIKLANLERPRRGNEDSNSESGSDFEVEIASEDERGNIRLKKKKGRNGGGRGAPKLTYDPRTGRSRRTNANYQSYDDDSDSDAENKDPISKAPRLKRKESERQLCDSDDDFTESGFFGDARPAQARKKVRLGHVVALSGTETDDGESAVLGSHTKISNDTVISATDQERSLDVQMEVKTIASDQISSSTTQHNSGPANSSYDGFGMGMTLMGIRNESSSSFTVSSVSSVGQNMKQRIDQLRLPNNPLDTLITALGGPGKVAELTGRKLRAVVDPNNPARFVYENRNVDGMAQKDVNLVERDAFQSGRKLVAIISEAASAGISLQADRRVRNQRRRVHITIELAWSADKAIQQLGRSHRSNQSSAPEYILVISDIGGEMRFASAVAKRLESLGALTKGDRRATDGISLSNFNFETKWGKLALEALHSNIDGRTLFPVMPDGLEEGENADSFFGATRNAFEALGLADNGTDDAKVKKFLNRLLGIHPVTLQNKIFDYFLRHLKIVLDEARRNGHLDSGIEDVGGSLCTVKLEKEPVLVFQDAFSKIKTQHWALKVDRGLTFEDATNIHEEWKNDHPRNGWYISKSGESVLLARDSGKSGVHARVYKPHLGEVVSLNYWSDLLRGHTRVHDAQVATKVKKLWDRQYESSVTLCTHAMMSLNGRCKNVAAGLGCTVGKRVREYHILAGAVVPVWTKVEDALLQAGCTERIKIVRATVTEMDRRIIGILIPVKFVSHVLAALAKAQVTGDSD